MKLKTIKDNYRYIIKNKGIFKYNIQKKYTFLGLFDYWKSYGLSNKCQQKFFDEYYKPLNK